LTELCGYEIIAGTNVSRLTSGCQPNLAYLCSGPSDDAFVTKRCPTKTHVCETRDAAYHHIKTNSTPDEEIYRTCVKFEGEKYA